MFSGGSLVPAAEKWIETLITVQETLMDNIKEAKELQKAYFDCHTRKVPAYEKGDRVWLLQRNITTTHYSPLLKNVLQAAGFDLPMGHDV